MAGKKAVVNLVCGPLGIGKTTAIINYLKATASSQFTAVLVNDFGPVGLDAAIMEGDLASSPAKANTSIKMLPGGCVCCTSAVGLLSAFEQLWKLPRLDRVIIEPSGLAMVGDMVDLVTSLSAQYPLEVRPVITLVEPRLIDRPGFLQAPYYIRMVEAADILVANRCDLASADQMARFDEWSAKLYPQKLRTCKVTQGQLPLELYDLSRDAKPLTHAAPAHRHGHTEGQHAGGCIFEPAVIFDVDSLERLLQEFAVKGFVGNEVLRLKAILHTNDGWKLYEIARGQNYVRPTDYRRDSRIDWITQGVPVLDEAVKQRFAECVSG